MLMSESAWHRLRDVETCVAANFPIVRQLGLFQIMPGTPPEWVYEIRGLVPRPLLRPFPMVTDGQPLRKITCVRPGRGLHVTYPPTSASAKQAVRGRVTVVTAYTNGMCTRAPCTHKTLRPPCCTHAPKTRLQELVFVSARIQLRSSAPSAVHTVATAAHKRLRKALSTIDRFRPGIAAARVATRHIAAQDSSFTLGGFPAHPSSAPGGQLRAKSARSILSGVGSPLDGMLAPGACAICADDDDDGQRQAVALSPSVRVACCPHCDGA